MVTGTGISGWTVIGLLIAFCGGTLVLLAFSQFAPKTYTDIYVVARELSFFAVACILIWIIIDGEEADLSSIGLNNKHWGKSLLFSLFLVVLCYAVVAICLLLFKVTGISFGEGDGKYDKISLWVMTLVMLRAGIVEEIFFRGYAMERLEKISNSWIVFLLIPSTIFGLLHFRQGLGGIVIAFSTGLLMSYVYWKKRDLKANIIAHFLVDFIPNVLVPLIMGGQ